MKHLVFLLSTVLSTWSSSVILANCDSAMNIKLIRTDSMHATRMCLGDIGVICYFKFYSTKQEKVYFKQLYNNRNNLIAEGYVMRKGRRKSELIGEWRYYYENKLRKSGTYSKGFKDGFWFDYDNYGNVIYKNFYSLIDGVLGENVTFFDSFGYLTSLNSNQIKYLPKDIGCR